MLHLADQHLIQRDRELPGLAILFDQQVLLAHFRRAFPALNITALTPTRLSYQPAKRCLLQCDLVTATGHNHGYVLALPKESLELQALTTHVGEGATAVCAASALLLQHFPHDRQLPQVSRLMTAELRAELGEELFSDQQGVSYKSPAIIDYQAEQRCIVQLHDEDKALWFQHVPASQFTAFCHNMQALQALPGLKLPHIKKSSSHHHIIVTEAFSGERLDDVLALSAASELSTKLAIDLALLHQQYATGLRPPLLSDSQRIRARIASLSWLQPALSRRLTALGFYLCEQFENTDVVPSIVVADLECQRIFVKDGELALLAGGQAYLGNPAWDLAQWIASLFYQQQQGRLNTAARDLMADFLEAYYLRATTPPTQLHCYIIAELLAKMSCCFSQRLPNWPVAMLQLLDIAEELIPSRKKPLLAMA